jgi:hypothetical protein
LHLQVWNAYQYLGSFHRRTYNNAGVIQKYDYAVLPTGGGFSPGFYQEYSVSNYNSSLMVIYQSWWKVFLTNDTAKTWVNLTSLFPVSGTDYGINYVLFGLRLGGSDNQWAHYVFTNTQVLKRMSAAGPYQFVPWPPANYTSCQPKRAAADPDDGNFIAVLCGDGRVVYTTDGGVANTSWTLVPSNIGGADSGRIVVVPVRMPYNPTRTIVASCSSCRVKYFRLDNSTGFVSVNGTSNALHMDLRWDATTSSLVVATLGRGMWGISPPPFAVPQAPAPPVVPPVAPAPVAAPKAPPVAAPKAAPVAAPKAAPVAAPKAAAPVGAPKVAAPAGAPKAAPIGPPPVVPAPVAPPVMLLAISIEANETLTSQKQASLMSFVSGWFGQNYAINPDNVTFTMYDLGNLTYIILIDFNGLDVSMLDVSMWLSDQNSRDQLKDAVNADLTSGTGQDASKLTVKLVTVLPKGWTFGVVPTSGSGSPDSTSNGSPDSGNSGTPTSGSSGTPDSNSGNGAAPTSALPVPLIAGVIAGFVALVLLIGLTVFLVRRYKK